MKDRDAWENIKKIMLLLGITLAVYLGMRYVLPAVVPFCIGGLLAMCFNPLVVWMEKKTHKSRKMISMGVIMVLMVVAAVLLYVFCKIAWGQACALIEHKEAARSYVYMIWCDCCKRCERNLGIAIEDPEGMFADLEERLRCGLQNKMFPLLLKKSVVYAKGALSLLGVLLVSVVAAMLMLADYEKIKIKIYHSQMGSTISVIKSDFQKAGGMYLKAQLIILLVITGICIIGMVLAGNPYALIAGLGIGLCDALPFFGSGTVLVPCFLVGILNGKYILAGIYGILYLVCSFARQILEPRLIGERLGYPPVAILMSIYIGIYVYGLPGVLLGPISAFLIWELYRATLDNCRG